MKNYLTIRNGIVEKCYRTAVKVEIPATYDGIPVTTIKSYAFSECADLVEVKIPNTITKIEDGAFNCCFKLQPFTLPSSIDAQKPFQCCGILKQCGIPVDGSSLTFYSVRADFYNYHNIVRSFQDGKIGLYDALAKTNIVPPIFDSMHIPISGLIDFCFGNYKFRGNVVYREDFIKGQVKEFQELLLAAFNNKVVNNDILTQIIGGLSNSGHILYHFESPNWGVEIFGHGNVFEELKQLL